MNISDPGKIVKDGGENWGGSRLIVGKCGENLEKRWFLV
jgi:hypothetical protein